MDSMSYHGARSVPQRDTENYFNDVVKIRILLSQETEDKLRKSEERLKAITAKVRDAEVFLKESTNFHRFLNKDSVGEDKITQLQQRFATCKENHEENSKV